MSDDPGDLESTQAVYDVFAEIVSSGHKLDLIDTWNDEWYGGDPILVSLCEVSRTAFQFFEGCRFEFSA